MKIRYLVLALLFVLPQVQAKEAQHSSEPAKASSAKQHDDVAALNKQLESLSSISAKFKQWTTDSTGARLQESEGELLVKRPNLFRWEVDTPFPQVVISNGEKVKMYDKDLAQVTVQKLDRQLSVTPALLLSGNTSQLRSSFQVSRSENKGEVSYLLKPKAPDSVFESLRLSFKGDKINDMLITDALGARTRILFSDVKNNGSIASSHFKLKLPKGVDVIDEQGS